MHTAYKWPIVALCFVHACGEKDFISDTDKKGPIVGIPIFKQSLALKTLLNWNQFRGWYKLHLQAYSEPNI